MNNNINSIIGDFKKNVSGGLKRLTKKTNIKIKQIDMVNSQIGFKITLWMSPNVPDLDVAIAKVIYTYKPQGCVTVGASLVIVKNHLGRQCEIRFTRRTAEE